MKKFLAALILALAFFVISLSDGQSQSTEFITDYQADTSYLAVKGGKLGLLSVPNLHFDTLYGNLKVHQIVGLLDQDNVVVIGQSWDAKISSFPQLYQIDLQNLSLVKLIDNIQHASISPDQKKIAYTVYNPNILEKQLFYKDISSNTTQLISQTVRQKPWWNIDSSQIIYTSGEHNIIAYNLADGQKTKLSIKTSDNLFVERWINDHELLVRYRSTEDRQIFASYDLKVNALVKTLLDDQNVEFILDAQNNNLLTLTTDLSSKTKVLNVVNATTGNNLTVAQVPLYNNDFGYASSVFFNSKFISDTQVFYQVLTSENHDLVSCGVVDIQTKSKYTLEKDIWDIGCPFPTP